MDESPMDSGDQMEEPSTDEEGPIDEEDQTAPSEDTPMEDSSESPDEEQPQ